jgi:hypothetical protein
MATTEEAKAGKGHFGDAWLKPGNEAIQRPVIFQGKVAHSGIEGNFH